MRRNIMLLNHAFPETAYVYRLDDLVRLERGKREVIVPLLQQKIGEIEVRKRARQPNVEADFRLTLEIIVANVVSYCLGRMPMPRIRYPRKFEAYCKHSVYRPRILKPKTLFKTIDLLGNLGFLELTPGYIKFETGDSKQSTFIPTDRFLKLLESSEVSSANIYSEPIARPVLVLKDTKKKWLEYDPEASGIREIAQEVREYNERLKKQDIFLAVSEAEMLDIISTPQKDGTPRYPIDFSKASLYRVFNNGSWCEGGRHVGGWWQNIPAKYRPRLIINGEQTVELDISGFIGRLLYHLNKLKFPGDPYEVPIIFEAAASDGIPRETIRSTVKGMMVKMICARPGRSAGFKSAILPVGMTKKEACRLIVEHHKPIAAAFNSGMGPKISFLESQICEHVLSRVTSSTFVLPVFDSFIAPARSRAWLKQTIYDGYRKHVGGIPVISEK